MRITRQIHASALTKAMAVSAAIHLSPSACAASGDTPPLTTTQYQFTYIEIPGNTFMAPFGPSGPGGQFYTFPTPGFGALTGINDQGVVAGTYTLGDGPW